MRRPVRRFLALPAAFALLLLGLGSAAAGESGSAPRKAESRFRVMIREGFPQYEIQDAAGKDGEQGYRFQVFDDRNGYARVVGPFEGYQDFFLVRGKSREHLISVEYQCQPACSQRVTIQSFDAGAPPAPVPLMKALDLSRFETLRRRLINLCLDPEGNFDTQPDARAEERRKMPACPFVFSFPKRRSAAILFKVVDENGSDLLLSVGKTNVSPQARLRWNGSLFVGGAPPDDAGSIFLNDDKMRELF
jgi:hypothetical protein